MRSRSLRSGAPFGGSEDRFGKTMWTFALLAIPLYVGAGRVKNQAHWQTDVIAGWAVGGLSGWYAQSRDVPIMIEILPHGFAVGWKAQF